jgi:hypothetical protein
MLGRLEAEGNREQPRRPAGSVRRGDILLFVTFRPGKPGEISFTGGYPFAGGSTVEVIG